jgi:hypothetical protein
MKKGIGPRGLGAPKSAAKMYGAKSPAKQATPSKKEQDYIVAQNKKADEKLARKNDIKDGQTASYRLKQDWMPRTDANFNKAKAKATKDRIREYGFPESVSDK